MEKNKIVRTRNWATIIYPESAAENWIEILKRQCVPALISPLHDKDIIEKNSGDEDINCFKKPHYHVVIMFQNVKTEKQAEEIFKKINGVGVEIVHCLKSYASYLCHLNDPDKAQYSISDVIACAGADYYSIISMPSNKYEVISEMIDFCIEQNVISYAELLCYSKEERPDWFRLLCDSATVTIVQFLKSRYWQVNLLSQKKETK